MNSNPISSQVTSPSDFNNSSSGSRSSSSLEPITPNYYHELLTQNNNNNNNNSEDDDSSSTTTTTTSRKRSKSNSNQLKVIRGNSIDKNYIKENEHIEGLTDKACRSCKTRKVRCSKNWPTCKICASRGESCDYGNLIPISAVDNRLEEKMGEETGALVGNMSKRLDVIETQLETLTFEPDVITIPPFSESIQTSFQTGSQMLSRRETFEFLQKHVALNYHEHISSHSTSWNLATSTLARALTLHLINSFFISCCAYLPCFSAWHNRVDYIRGNIDTLDPGEHVAVASFCAMGARASPHSALLGIPVAAPGQPNFVGTTVAGVRREQACRAIHQQALDLVHKLEITYDAKVGNLESLVVVMQMLIFNEIAPRKSRTLILSVLHLFKDLQECDEIDEETRNSMVWRLGLPIAFGDSIVAAYAKKSPLISIEDLETYFKNSPLELPNFNQDILDEIIQPLLSSHKIKSQLEQNKGGIEQGGMSSHEDLVSATTTIACWLAQAQRTVAYLTSAKTRPPHSNLVQQILLLWSAIDQIHSTVACIQTFLVNLSQTPPGCAAIDGCSDLHLRFVTRLDRDLMDVDYIIWGFISENSIKDEIIQVDENNSEELWNGLRFESEKRVRKALKLTAFYSQLYISSQDHHMVYHVFFQLEILPDWNNLVLQRFGEPNGPSDSEIEVSETELDWIEQGLLVASFYHPVANGRLLQLQANRRPPRLASMKSATADEDPAAAVRHTSTLGNVDGSQFSMPQAISSLTRSNAQALSRFNSIDDHRQTSTDTDHHDEEDDVDMNISNNGNGNGKNKGDGNGNGNGRYYMRD